MDSVLEKACTISVKVSTKVGELQVADVAKYLGVQPHTVYRLTDDGKLQAEQRSVVAQKQNGELQPRRGAPGLAVPPFSLSWKRHGSSPASFAT